MIAVYFLVVLAFTPCGDAFSLDSRLAKTRKTRPAFAYAYPILLMQLMMAWVYVSSALIKLRVAGFKYLSVDNLPALAIFHSLDNLHDTHFKLAFWLPQVKGYLPFAVALVLIWELLFPLAVFWRRLRWWILGVGVVFHFSTLFLMNIFFPHQLVMYLIFVDWDRRFKSRMNNGKTIVDEQKNAC
jgi:Vitamin K-dependent gamma-carboxylase